MKVKAINLYTYKEPFKSPISTPKVKLTHRESLFTEIVTYSGEIYYGECNAFSTNSVSYTHLTLPTICSV